MPRHKQTEEVEEIDPNQTELTDYWKPQPKKTITLNKVTTYPINSETPS
jgi:hypothetical protein